MHFGISEGKGGLKLGWRLWLGMDIFWNCPICMKAPDYLKDMLVRATLQFEGIA